MKELSGIPSSRGIGIGPVFQFIRQELIIEDKSNIKPEEELKRLSAAISSAKEQINAIYEKALEESSDADAEIFQAHLLILEDPELHAGVESKIKNENKCAELAMRETGQSFSDVMAAMNDEYFAARATDILDVSNRVIRILLGIAESPTADLKEPSVVLADDLTP